MHWTDEVQRLQSAQADPIAAAVVDAIRRAWEAGHQVGQEHARHEIRQALGLPMEGGR